MSSTFISTYKNVKSAALIIGLDQIYLNLLRAFLILFLGSLFAITINGQSENLTKTAWSLANSGEIDKAITKITNAIDLNDKNPKYLSSRANFYFMKGDYDKSLTDCQVYLSKFPGTCDIYILMGDIAFMKKDYLKSVDFYSTAQSYSKGLAESQYCLLKRGASYNQLELYNKAHVDLVESKGIFGLDSLYLYNIAYCQFYMNQTNEAKESLKKLFEMYPDYPKAFGLLASINLNDGQFRDAITALKRCIEVQKGTQDQYELLFKLALQEKDTLTALKALDKKIELYSGNFEEEVLLSKLYYSQGNYTKAAICVESASKKSPEDPLVYKIKGDIYLKRNNVEIACDCYFIAFKKGYLLNYNDNLLDTYIKLCE